MAQVIIYANENGGVSMTIPTGALTIEEVLVKDCPVGAIIVDESDLPEDHTYFNAWELVNGKVVVNQTKKQAMIDAKQAVESSKQSALNKLAAIGLTSDEIKQLLGV